MDRHENGAQPTARFGPVPNTKSLTRALPDDWICRCQSGATTDDSQPEPDIAVVRGPDEPL